ncbi:hypothetical protein ACFO25_16865 [Paenactinomyces guangxiensis]|uniref:Uncharacterized protein n=1 Tax=Paenactinomyces guangxiensis TaxID=1490290 RepID=A0A7W2AAP9_9BACL|nr:hypothetical protein [Paenactinomyces guangxiensis]MBA4496429.1 hypothetical protein [Paenactinomyces guangxiensis]MBH8593530.1 hypothetical protein [Paenactinomyces guangxiensis]
MVKIQIEGPNHEVQCFLYELQRCSQFKSLKEQVASSIKNETKDGTEAGCFINYLPDQRMRIVQMVTPEGGEIRIPLFDVIHVEIEKGVKVFAGKGFDAFS